MGFELIANIVTDFSGVLTGILYEEHVNHKL